MSGRPEGTASTASDWTDEYHAQSAADLVAHALKCLRRVAVRFDEELNGGVEADLDELQGLLPALADARVSLKVALDCEFGPLLARLRGRRVAAEQAASTDETTDLAVATPVEDRMRAKGRRAAA